MTIDQILAVESGGDPYARNPRSSAYGAGQFIESTWLDMLARNRPDLVQGKSRTEILALRSDPSLSREMTAAYAADNANALRSAGLPVTAGTTYLAHFAGPKGAVSVLGADPSAPVSSVLGEAAVRANPFLKGMTTADLRAWADRKMGGGSPEAAAPPVQPAAGAASGAATAFGSLAPAMTAQQQQPQSGFNPQAVQSALTQLGMLGGQAMPMPVPAMPGRLFDRLKAAGRNPFLI